MNWTELIKTLLGPLIGAAIALAAIWLKEFFDRRRAVQAWYEERYIREGLDRIASYILTVEYYLSYPSDSPPIPKEMLQLPVEAISRIQVALQTEVFTMSLTMLHHPTEHTKFRNDMGNMFRITNSLAHQLRWSIDSLRKEMLAANIRRRADIYEIADQPEIKRILKDVAGKVEKFNEEFQDEAKKVSSKLQTLISK